MCAGDMLERHQRLRRYTAKGRHRWDPGPTAVADVICRVTSHFNTIDSVEAFRRLTAFSVTNKIFFRVYARTFWIMVSSVSGSVRAIALTIQAVL